MSNLKYASVTSVDVEYCFSIYKNMLRDIRRWFKLHSLEKYSIINANENILREDDSFCNQN